MADKYYASISIPTRFITEAVKEWIIAEIGKWNFDAASEEEGVTFFKNDFAHNGYFEDLEVKLVEAGIPFDRNSSGFGEYKPEIRYFRPGVIDKSIMVTNDGDPYIETYELKKLLDFPSNTDVINKLAELIQQADPVVTPLENLALEEIAS